MVVTDLKPSLRRFAIEKSSYYYKRSELILPYDVEYSLAKLLDRELEMGRNIQLNLSALSYRYDYNHYDLFDVLDNYKFSYITHEKY